MAVKKPNVWSSVSQNSRTPEDFERNKARLKNLYELVDKKIIGNLVRDYLANFESESIGNALSPEVSELAKALYEAAVKQGKIEDTKKESFEEQVTSILSEPWIKKAKEDNTYIQKQAEKISWALTRHWVNSFTTLQKQINHDGFQLFLNDDFLPIQPEGLEDEKWEQWKSRSKSSLEHILADYPFDYSRALKALEHFHTALVSTVRAHEGSLELPERLHLVESENRFCILDSQNIPNIP